MKETSPRAFTLIELLVVIAIIGILASVVIASLSSARVKAREARRLADMTTIRTALYAYFSDHGCLPVTTGSTCGPASGGAYSESNTSSWDSSFEGNFLTFLETGGYLAEVPVDPINNSSSYYRYFCYPSSNPTKSGQLYLASLRESPASWNAFINDEPGFACR